MRSGPPRSILRNPLADAIVALAVLLVVFGPKRLPMLGRSLGHGIREFRRSIGGRRSAEDEARLPALLPGHPTQAAKPSQASSEH